MLIETFGVCTYSTYVDIHNIYIYTCGTTVSYVHCTTYDCMYILYHIYNIYLYNNEKHTYVHGTVHIRGTIYICQSNVVLVLEIIGACKVFAGIYTYIDCEHCQTSCD